MSPLNSPVTKLTHPASFRKSTSNGSLSSNSTSPVSRMIRRISTDGLNTLGIARKTPPPFMPAMQGEHPCVRNSECAMCFGALRDEYVSVCVDKEGLRTCRHMYHSRCLQLLMDRRCLLCGAPFAFRQALPDILEEPASWFKVADAERRGEVTRIDLFLLLLAQLPLDAARLDAFLKERWRRWDRNNDERLSQEEIFGAKNGLMTALKRHKDELRNDLSVAQGVPPDLRSDASSWFDFYDVNGSKTLSRDEVIRGLSHSFDAVGDPVVVSHIRATLEAVWSVFDPDNSGDIDRSEFLMPKDGLADSIIASLALRSRPSSRNTVV